MKILICTLLLTILLSPLRALDGVDFYYGLGVEKDYRRALVEFKKEANSHVDILFQVLIYLNGDGVPQDSAKALEIWKTKIDRAGWTDMTTINLKKVIDDRLVHQASTGTYLSFEDIAMTTVDINEAADIRARIQESRKTKLFAEIESRLGERELYAWSKLKQLSAKISRLDSERVFTEYIDGTIRTAYSFGIRHLILESFLNRSEQWLLHKPTFTSSETAFSEIDGKLNTTYQALRRSLSEEYQEVLDMYRDDSDSQGKYRTYMKEMSTGLINAQRAWIEYRDTWVELILERNLGANERSVELYVKSEISKDRVNELDYTRLE